MLRVPVCLAASHLARRNLSNHIPEIEARDSLWVCLTLKRAGRGYEGT